MEETEAKPSAGKLSLLKIKKKKVWQKVRRKVKIKLLEMRFLREELVWRIPYCSER